MLNWFKKKQPEPTEPKRSTGLFSTDVNVYDKKNPFQALEVLKQTFQKTAEDFVVKNADGTTYAMDSDNASGLKLTNNYGEGLPWAQIAWYASQGFIGYQNAAMIAQQWLVDKACSMPAEDAVRNGFELTLNDGTELDPKVMNEIKEKDKDYKLDDHLVEYIRKGRIFGIRVLKFVVDSPDDKYYEKPFNPDGIRPGSYKGMVQIDPYWITPELDQAAVTPGTLHFYVPTWWRVGNERIHRSHLAIFINGNVPDILKPTYLYGGISVPQKVAERVYAAERTANEAPMLVMTKRLTVLKTDMTQAMSNLPKFKSMLQLWSDFMNNYGIKAIGGEEEVTQFDTALGDVDNVTMTQYQLVSAASDVPATKLLGTSPKGFNATGGYEEKSYRQLLESLQKNKLCEVVDRHHVYVARSDFPAIFKKKPFKIHCVWRPTDSPTTKEIAEVNKLKADTDTQLVNAGAIDGYDIRNRIIADECSGYNGIPAIVEGGPGDREAQQEAEAAQLNAKNSKNDKGDIGKDGLESPDDEEGFDFDTGKWNGARIITHQRFLNEEKVAEKIRTRDFMVNVTPEFWQNGKKYRMVMDGHHSLAAAMRERVIPEFTTDIPLPSVFNAATRLATDKKEA